MTLPTPHPVPPNASDLRSALASLAPGWYRASQLLPVFVAWARANGRQDITAKTLGESIVREFRPERRMAHGHVAVYDLTAEHLGHA